MKISINGLLVDPLPNSPKLHCRNCMIDIKENNYRNLKLGCERVEGLVSIGYIFFQP